MKFLKFLQGSILALALLALVGFSQKAQAQYTLNPATVDISQPDFQALYSYGVIPVTQVSAAQFISNGPGTGTAPWPPIGPEPPCPDADGMTPALAQYMSALANQLCKDVYICVQEKNCYFYLWVFRPTDPNCFSFPAYQAVLQSYAM